MRTSFLYILLGWLLALPLQAQNFEGIIEMTQNSNGVNAQVKWYIKKDKIACEVQAQTAQGPLTYRFIPQPEKGTILIITNGTSKMEVAAGEITPSANVDTRNLQVEDLGPTTPTQSNPELQQLRRLMIRNNQQIETDFNYTPLIDVPFHRYAAYFKDDYGIQALAQTKRDGFPVSSTTKDRSGKVIGSTRIDKITRMSLPDSHFK